jgi:hypothetical protein
MGLKILLKSFLLLNITIMLSVDDPGSMVKKRQRFAQERRSLQVVPPLRLPNDIPILRQEIELNRSAFLQDYFRINQLGNLLVNFFSETPNQSSDPKNDNPWESIDCCCTLLTLSGIYWYTEASVQTAAVTGAIFVGGACLLPEVMK